jgi:hypothetical protein
MHNQSEAQLVLKIEAGRVVYAPSVVSFDNNKSWGDTQTLLK